MPLFRLTHLKIKTYQEVIRIQEKIHHRIGRLTPSNNKDEIYAQIYFKGEFKLIQDKNIQVNTIVILQIQALLSDNKNPFISQLKQQILRP